MKYSQAMVETEVIVSFDYYDMPIKFIRYNGRKYTCFGKLVAVPGWVDKIEGKRYQFTDWNSLRGMYLEK